MLVVNSFKKGKRKLLISPVFTTRKEERRKRHTYSIHKCILQRQEHYHLFRFLFLWKSEEVIHFIHVYEKERREREIERGRRDFICTIAWQSESSRMYARS